MFEFFATGKHWDEFYLALAALTLIRCLWIGGWVARTVGMLLVFEWCVKNWYSNYLAFTPMLNAITGLALLCLTLYFYFGSGYQSKSLLWLIVGQVVAILACGLHSVFGADWSLALSLNIIFFLKIVAVHTQLGREAVPIGFRQTN